MSAFLFLPTIGTAGRARRVDFANIGSLFAEAEEPAPAGRRHAVLRTAGAMALILLLTLCDMVLMGRPDAGASLFKPQRPIGTSILRSLI